jgi:hypothetical protein
VVCQIDVLRRIKPDSDIVKKTLANLPRTLDETYERIFLEISDQDRPIVHYALRWMIHHHEQYAYNISCSILLQAIERGTGQSTASGRDYFYHEELLRELCGCLITITSEDSEYYLGFSQPVRTVSFAHYTVLEFLNSAQILGSSAASFAVTSQSKDFDLAEIMLREAFNQQPEYSFDIEDQLQSDDKIAELFETNFNVYCIERSTYYLFKKSHELSQVDKLSLLVFELLNPSRPHFKHFSATAWHAWHNEKSAEKFIGIDFMVLAKRERVKDLFWSLNKHPSSAETGILLSLLLLTQDKDLVLVSKFLPGISVQEVLKDQVDFIIHRREDDGTDSKWNQIHFHGSIIELFAQLAALETRPFRFLLEELVKCGADSFDPSTVLLSYIGSHFHHSPCRREDYCPLLRLLELGAKTKVTGYSVTPLQIAATSWDLQGVRILLEAGADPKNIGDSGGMTWAEDSLMGRYNCLRDSSPLNIARRVRIKSYPAYLQDEESEDDSADIEALLLQHGAKEGEISSLAGVEVL